MGLFTFFKPKSPDISETCSRLETWIKANAPHLTSAINAPATQQEIDDLEKILGANLPEDFVAFLKIHNGQDQDSDGLINTEELLSTDRITDEWKVWKTLLEKGDLNLKSEPDKGIKSDWWNAKWIPITYDGSGNHYCIDLDPANGGQYGQIIRMWHDSSERELIAPSFKAWLNSYVGDLEKGNYVYSEDWGGIIHKDDL